MSNSLDPDRPEMLSGLIWVQTVCKGYHQTTKVAISGERVNGNIFGNECYCYMNECPLFIQLTTKLRPVFINSNIKV